MKDRGLEEFTKKIGDLLKLKQNFVILKIISIALRWGVKDVTI